jgi:protein-arginine kinase
VIPASTVLNVIALSVGLVLGVSGVIAAVWCVARVKGFDIVVNLNNELRQGLTDERAARAADLERFTKELADDRVECARSIGVLQGQVSALTDGLAEKLLSSMISAIRSPERRQSEGAT